jgi:hypothetical protein
MLFLVRVKVGYVTFNWTKILLNLIMLESMRIKCDYVRVNLGEIE